MLQITKFSKNSWASKAWLLHMFLSQTETDCEVFRKWCHSFSHSLYEYNLYRIKDQRWLKPIKWDFFPQKSQNFINCWCFWFHFVELYCLKIVKIFLKFFFKNIKFWIGIVWLVVYAIPLPISVRSYVSWINFILQNTGQVQMRLESSKISKWHSPYMFTPTSLSLQFTTG